MESRQSGPESGRSRPKAAAADEDGVGDPASAGYELPDSESESSSRQRLFDEVLASVELVLEADGAAFWHEEPDHSLVLTAGSSISSEVLEAFDRHVTTPLQSIMQRWPESPLVAVPLNDPTNTIADEIREITDREGIAGLAGVPCRVSGETLGILLIIHKRPHPWTVRDLGLATGLAGQLATAMQNARLYASVRSMASRLAAIHELSLRLNQLRDVDAIGEAIVAEVGRLVDCDTVRVYRLDSGGAFRPVAASGTFVGISSPPLEALSTGHSETLPAWVAKRNEPLIIADATLERRSIFRSTFGPESLLLVPVSYGDTVHGVLVVSKQGANRYDKDDERALSIFARYAAQAIVNADNIDELERQHALLEQQVAAERRLLDLSEQLVSTLDPRRVLEQIAETIGTVVHYDRLTIYRHEAAGGGIEPVLTRVGLEGSGDAADLADPVDEGLTSWVIGRGDAVCANDAGEEVLARGFGAAGSVSTGPGGRSQTASTGAGTREGRTSQNIIVVPLRVHGQVVGSLNLTRFGGPEARFSDHEFELGKLFAGQASIALQNAEMHFTVSSRADLDALTGLRNHGTFRRDIAAMVEAGDRFALLMMDLDSFKTFNDTYGHPAGDTLLQTVARAIVSATRQNDKAYRYGGDEFAVLLWGASRATAEEVANRIRSAVSEAVQSSSVGALGGRVTASVGAAQWPADGRSTEDLIEAADAALYRAKRERDDGATLPRTAAPTRASAGWVDAARTLIRARTAEAVAVAMVGGVTALCEASDAFVALREDLCGVSEPAIAGSGTVPVAGVAVAAATITGAAAAAGATADQAVAGAGSGAREAATSGRQTRLKQIAASGAYEASPLSIHPGAALWSRVWQSGQAESEEKDGLASYGAPLMVDGATAGVLGVTVAAAASTAHDLAREVALVADLGSAAFQRLADGRR
jgi:diguanylate cyclase (GGDEF)-like protein